MIINILAGGPEAQLPELNSFQENEVVWVGVDRGVFTLLSHGIEPQMAFGDFDSVNEEELQFIHTKVKSVRIYKSEKDEPDMELALTWAIEQKPERIRLFGATGGRLDHFLANVQLLLRPLIEESPILIEIIDHQNLLYAVRPGTHQIKKDEQKKYISFLPIQGAVENLTLAGFKYPLKDRHIPPTSTLCISNELIDDCGTFSFTEGILLVIRSKD
ncbi:thiamine diphosphokinase [Robertmurraya kyonggiensis]|uniref:Thiamine diphosphokinase n=1 Tax=Robertmurraya kyonggiensis TaxID=1037680 RepID=A0A4V5P1P4_9BACI|nr:thiamine diphosphokinase [Robertmurraya kyonggiensis]TKC18620.1 thiamine diphosphokinase [Robertmurraya kyonggiensis]